MKIVIDSGELSLDTLRDAWTSDVWVELGPASRQRIDASAARVREVLESGRQVYGVNTGFGQLAQVKIGNSELQQLQRNLLLSHASGVGACLQDDVVRLLMLMKVAALAKGYSGATVDLIERLCGLLNAGIYPRIPSKGSVGASGDLAPLAHMAGTLLGLGEVTVKGQVLPAAEALAAAGMTPYELQPKEGLALINGTQASTALALAGYFKIERLFGAALLAGALSADAIKGSDTPFDERIHAVRGHRGQIDVAAALRELMSGSDIRRSHRNCDRVQDPYSIRCQPQVMGSCLDAMRHVAGILETESSAVTDNPLVFDDGSVLSGGNFHAEPVAMAADYLALAIAEIGAISERRTALLIDSHMSGLPAFLVADGGINSGFMMPQVTAAALASENKSLAHPASVDSLPTSANQEDHVSMATFAARRLHDMLDNSASIVAIELLAAAQGIEFHRPEKSSPVLEALIQALRRDSGAYDKDRSLSAEIEGVATGILTGRYDRHTAGLLGVPGS